MPASGLGDRFPRDFIFLTIRKSNTFTNFGEIRKQSLSYHPWSTQICRTESRLPQPGTTKTTHSHLCPPRLERGESGRHLEGAVTAPVDSSFPQRDLPGSLKRICGQVYASATGQHEIPQ